MPREIDALNATCRHRNIVSGFNFPKEVFYRAENRHRNVGLRCLIHVHRSHFTRRFALRRKSISLWSMQQKAIFWSLSTQRQDVDSL